jgi:hypothetical protein
LEILTHILLNSVLNPPMHNLFDHNEIFDGFYFRLVEQDEVFQATMSIKSETVDHDNLPLKFVKLILPELFPVFTHVANFIIMSSSFPCAWKVGLVVPIHRSGGVGTLSDFRPISILPALSKIVEKRVGFEIFEPEPTGFQKP